MSLNDLLNHWRDTPTIAPNIAAWHTRPAQPAQTASLPTNLHPTLAHILHELGIHQLYTHQAAAWTHLQAGRRPVIVTGTASGKTLCYNLPVLDHLLNDPHARALYRALRHYLDVPVELVVYPGEGHGNRVDRNRYDYALRCLRWFDHYLKGEGGDPPPAELDYDAYRPKEPATAAGT